MTYPVHDEKKRQRDGCRHIRIVKTTRTKHKRILTIRGGKASDIQIPEQFCKLADKQKREPEKCAINQRPTRPSVIKPDKTDHARPDCIA